MLEGELDEANALARAFGAIAALGKADPVDNLICVPHSEIVRTPDGARHAKLAAELPANGDRVWDASAPMTRTSVLEHVGAWRIVQYGTCRGLEGCATLLLAIDNLYANRIKHLTLGRCRRADRRRSGHRREALATNLTHASRPSARLPSSQATLVRSVDVARSRKCVAERRRRILSGLRWSGTIAVVDRENVMRRRRTTITHGPTPEYRLPKRRRYATAADVFIRRSSNVGS